MVIRPVHISTKPQQEQLRWETNCDVIPMELKYNFNIGQKHARGLPLGTYTLYPCVALNTSEKKKQKKHERYHLPGKE